MVACAHTRRLLHAVLLTQMPVLIGENAVEQWLALCPTPTMLIVYTTLFGFIASTILSALVEWLYRVKLSSAATLIVLGATIGALAYPFIHSRTALAYGIGGSQYGAGQIFATWAISDGIDMGVLEPLKIGIGYTVFKIFKIMSDGGNRKRKVKRRV